MDKGKVCGFASFVMLGLCIAPLTHVKNIMIVMEFTLHHLDLMA